MTTESNPSLVKRLRPAALFGAFILGYCITNAVGMGLYLEPEHVSTFWVAEGFVVAVLVLTRYRLWAVLLSGSMVAHYLLAVLAYDRSITFGILTTIADGLQSLVSAFLLRRWIGPSIDLARLKNAGYVVAAIVVGLVLATPIGTMGVITSSGDPFWSSCQVWACASFAGTLLVAMVIVGWSSISRDLLRCLSWRWLLEGCTLIVAIAAATYLGFGVTQGRHHSIFEILLLILPLLVWVSLRFHPRVVLSATLLISLILVSGAVRGKGPFLEPGLSARATVLSIQAFLVVMAITMFVISAVTAEHRLVAEERKRAEKELQGERDFVSAVLQTAGALVVVLDSGGRIEQFNRACERTTGYSFDEVKGMVFWDFLLLPEEKPSVQAVFQKLRAGDFPSKLQNHWVTKDGSLRLVDWSNTALVNSNRSVVHIIGTGVDITERKQAEEALRISELRFRRLTEASIIGVIIADEVKITEANDFFLEMIGYTREELRAGKIEWSNITPLEYADLDQKSLRHVLATGVFVPFEKEYIRKDETRVPILLGGALLSKSPLSILCFALDLTAIRQADAARQQVLQELKVINETLEQRVAQRTALAEQRAAQLRALASQLTLAEQQERRRLAAVLHDNLQQLLVSAKLHASMLQGKAEAACLRESVVQLENILSESIAAGRYLTAELSAPILYESGLAAALKWLRRKMNEQHGLTVEVEADSEIKADEEGVAILLFQSVRELLFNVAKHAEVKKAQVRMNRLDDDRIRIVVADEGVGFDAGRQAAGGSTYGFGLFSIRERIESLGGRLEIESALGRGTRITITVPIRRIEVSGQRAPTLAGEPISAISPEAYSPPSAPASAVTRRIRVLLVDDHMIVRQGLARLLQSEDDIEVAGEAGDGQSAVELARQLLPDVVVMDVSMPVMSGIEATRIITAELPFVRVIGLSIYHEADTAAAMREAGAVAYLNKGGRSEDLLAAIRGQRPADWPN